MLPTAGECSEQLAFAAGAYSVRMLVLAGDVCFLGDLDFVLQP